VVDKATGQIVCLFFAYGKMHDFKLFKRSKMVFKPETMVETDSGFQGIKAFHLNVMLPKKRTKKNKLSKEDKKQNFKIASERVLNEHIIGRVKRFRILSERYRNRRRRFALRFSLIAGICNFELSHSSPSDILFTNEITSNMNPIDDTHLKFFFELEFSLLSSECPQLATG
jgi:hypothetical protein